MQTDEGQRPQERLEERLGKLERDVLRVQKGQDALRKEVGDFQEKLSTAVLVLKNSVDQLAEAETQRSPRLQRGLSSSSSRDTGSKLTLRTLSDLLDLVLPKAVKDVVFLTPGLRDAIASAVLQPLLEKVGPGWWGRAVPHAPSWYRRVMHADGSSIGTCHAATFTPRQTSRDSG